MMRHKLTQLFIFLMLVMAFTCLPVDASYAADSTPPSTCTNDPTYNIPDNMQIITSIIDNVSCVLYGKLYHPSCQADTSVAERMFSNIATANTYKAIVGGAASLFIIIFALAFILGIVELTLMEFVIRAFKISVVLVMVTGVAWTWFYNTVGIFFQNGTNWLIARASQIALGTIPGLDPNQPFVLIDHAIATAFSAKMFVSIVAMFFTGPYGWLFGILMVLGLGSFVAALFQAVWIYLMALVVRAFLFGLAPIFVVFLLFARTRHLFDGWLNQLVNSMLQPVLLFTFFAFFVVLVQAAMENILDVNVCYMPGASMFQGLPGDMYFPRMTVNGQPYGGEWGFTGPLEFPGATPFAIDIVDVLIFLLITQLTWRFNSISVSIAKELAGVSTNLNIPGAFSELLSPRQNATRRVMEGSEDAIRRMSEGRGQGGQDARVVAGTQQMASAQVGLRNRPDSGLNSNNERNV